MIIAIWILALLNSPSRIFHLYELTIKQRLAKTGTPDEKTPDLPEDFGFLTCTTSVERPEI